MPKAQYWTIPDDGAPFRCKECDELGPASEMYFTEIPNGQRAMFHKTCLDPDWLKRAEFSGEFKA